MNAWTEFDTNPKQPLKVTPEQLLERLQQGFNSLEQLLDELKCSPDDLEETLSNHETCRLLRLKMQLAALQTQLAAIQYAPHAIARLIHLVDTAEKPEVVRRASTTLLQIAGLPTATKSQPAPPPIKESENPDDRAALEAARPEMMELRQAVALVLALKRGSNIDLTDVHDEDIPELEKLLYDFLTKRAKHIPPDLIYDPLKEPH